MYSCSVCASKWGTSKLTESEAEMSKISFQLCHDSQTNNNHFVSGTSSVITTFGKLNNTTVAVVAFFFRHSFAGIYRKIVISMIQQ